MFSKLQKSEIPFFTVVIPCYNGADYIEAAINSLEQQTFKDFEIIVVNDGSSDNSPSILNSLSSQLSSLSVIHQENKGLPAARNTAIKQMTGKWLVLLDADDIFLPERLNHLFQIINDNPQSEFLFHDSFKIDDQNIREKNSYIHRKYFFDDLKHFFLEEKQNNIYKVDANIWEFLLCNYTCMIPITICMSKSLIDSLGSPFDEELKVGEDVDFCVRCLSKLDHIIYSDVSLTEYRVHANSMTHSDNYIIRMLDYYRITQSKFYNRLSVKNRRIFIQKFSNHCVSASYSYRKQGRHIKALVYSIKSVYLQPTKHGLLSILKALFPAREIK